MNYDHLYHAGNHADVLKHLALITLIKLLSKKPTPWCYLDTHAGNGLYDLSALSRIATPEYKQGVQLLLANQNELPALCQYYLAMITNVQVSQRFRYYPGSPYFVKQLARADDRLIACELRTTSYNALKETFANDRQVAIHQMDGYLGLKAFIPPKEKRGLVLIDPPYEREEDWKQIITSVKNALNHWQSGHYLIWYPIKNKPHVTGWLRKLRANIENDILIIEMCPHAATGDQLQGSGLALINPVWQFSDQFEEVLAALWETLSINKQGYFRLQAIDLVLK